MRHIDPQRERASALRRSRVATHGIVLGAAVASAGVAGGLGLPAVLHPGASGTLSSSQQVGSDQDDDSDQTPGWILGGDDDGDLEGGLPWTPPQPSQLFGGGAATSTPHAHSGGS